MVSKNDKYESNFDGVVGKDADVVLGVPCGRECTLVLDDRLREVPKVPQMRLYDTSVYLRFSERGRVRSVMRRESAVAKGSERAALTCFISAE